MFTISPGGTLVDNMGFPLDSNELEQVLTAYQKSITQTSDERVEAAKSHCKTSHPNMFAQLDWEVFR